MGEHVQEFFLGHFMLLRIAISKNRKQQVLRRMWRDWNHCALLVGMQNSAAAVENNMAVPQKPKQSFFG